MHSDKIPSTQFSAVYRPGDNDLHLETDHAVEKPDKDEVLLKVAACGVCHSDVFLREGEFMDNRSYTLGHEICGKPVSLGPGTTGIDSNKFYCVFGISACTARTRVPKSEKDKQPGQPAILNSIGLGKDGGYAQYVVVNKEQLIEVPAGVRPDAAAIASDAGVTSYRAIITAGIMNDTSKKDPNNKRLLIIGYGGLGHIAVQIAKHFGAEVYVCDIKPEARKLAEELIGKDKAFSLIELNSQNMNGFSVDAVIDFVGTGPTKDLGFASLKNNAAEFKATSKNYVLVGVSDATLDFSGVDLISYQISVLSSEYGTKEDLRAVLDLIKKGDIRPRFEVRELDHINHILDELQVHNIRGRAVVKPHKEDF